MHKKHIFFVMPIVSLSVLLSPNLQGQDQGNPGGLRVVWFANTMLFRDAAADERLHFGEILSVTEQRDDWNYVPTHDGWVEESRLWSLGNAAAELDKQLETKPTPALYELRGRIALEQGEVEKAITCYQSGVKLPDAEAGLWNNLGLALQRDEQYQPALHAFSEAIRLAPESPLGYENRAGLLSLMGDHAASLADSNRAIAIDPHRAGAYNNRGVTYEMLGKPRKALADFNRALEEDPVHLDTLANRALLNVSQENWRAAAADYEQLRKYAPNNADLANDYAWLLATCPNKKVRDGLKAVDLAKLANRLTERRVLDYQDTLAAAFAEAGDFEQAAELQEELVKRRPGEEALRERLRLYKDRKPVRDPAR